MLWKIMNLTNDQRNKVISDILRMTRARLIKYCYKVKKMPPAQLKTEWERLNNTKKLNS